MSYVGIDVSKEVLDVAVLSGSGEVRHLKVSNNVSGHKRLVAELGANCQVVCEATGSYHRKLQEALCAAGIGLSVVNPRQALGYAKSQNRRNKTDKVDALLLAQFGLERRPAEPFYAAVQQALARELAALNEDLERLRNRLEAAEQGLSHREVINSLERRIGLLEEEKEQLKKQLQAELENSQPQQLGLLQSIPGIGLHSASLLLAELGDALRFRSARSLVAFAGLTPMLHESGKASKYSAISRMGSSHLRRILYMPAILQADITQVSRLFMTGLSNVASPSWSRLSPLWLSFFASFTAFLSQAAPSFLSSLNLDFQHSIYKPRP